jgi:hypothetical protein
MILRRRENANIDLRKRLVQAIDRAVENAPTVSAYMTQHMTPQAHIFEPIYEIQGSYMSLYDHTYERFGPYMGSYMTPKAHI